MPMVLALNMMDEVTKSGGSIDVLALSRELGIDVVPIVASRGEGIHELVDRAIAVAQEKRLPARQDFCTGEVHKAIHSISHIIEDHAREAGVPLRFAATKLVEGDEPMLENTEHSRGRCRNHPPHCLRYGTGARHGPRSGACRHAL